MEYTIAITAETDLHDVIRKFDAFRELYGKDVDFQMYGKQINSAEGKVSVADIVPVKVDCIVDERIIFSDWSLETSLHVQDHGIEKIVFKVKQ